jgi:hypothetical protein
MNFPTSLENWVTFLASLVAIVTGVVALLAWIYRKGFQNALKTIRLVNLQNRYEKLYAPMNALFITRHIYTQEYGQRSLPLYWEKRWGNTNQLLGSGQLFRAIGSLFDKDVRIELPDIEYGDIFPLAEIQRILQGNEAFADMKLLELLKVADKYRREFQGKEKILSITDAEYKLYEHIVLTTKKMRSLFSPKE